MRLLTQGARFRGAKTVFPVILLIGLGACELFGVDCTLEARSAIVVTVVDSITGGPVSGVVTASATDGTYTDTVQRPGEIGTLPLAGERPGTYDVEVSAPSYSPWTREEIRVGETDDGCHVRTVELTARLRPAEGS